MNRMITTDKLQEFKNIILEDYGLTLDDTEATKLAEDYLASLEAVLASPSEYLTKQSEGEQNDN